jgi:epoxyqueuosine reductase
MNSRRNQTNFIKSLAQSLGFFHCGIAKAVRLDEDARRLETWLNKGMHGTMRYMENHFEKRIDPSLLVPGARSVITLLMNYFPEKTQQEDAAKISKYAYGKDYHEIVRGKLKEFLAQLRNQIGEVNGRGFVDSAPVLERAWAVRSGLGWVGKNGNLIHKKAGSFFFIATLITDLELDYDNPFQSDHCGTCTRCIDACPTQAILPNKTIDGSRCISYYTIELKEAIIPNSMKEKFDDWMFGCDTCQDVCPWNRFSTPTEEAGFEPLPEIIQWTKQDWENMKEEAFEIIFKDSPIKRTGYKGILRNLRFIQPLP